MAKNLTREEFLTMLKDVLEVQEIPDPILKQVGDLVLNYRFSYVEIARCLVYNVDVLKHKIAIEYGIRHICLNLREKAEKYFKQLELDQRKQQGEAAKVVEYQENNIIFHISSLENKKRQPKQLDISDIDVTEGDS